MAVACVGRFLGGSGKGGGGDESHGVVELWMGRGFGLGLANGEHVLARFWAAIAKFAYDHRQVRCVPGHTHVLDQIDQIVFVLLQAFRVKHVVPALEPDKTGQFIGCALFIGKVTLKLIQAFLDLLKHLCVIGPHLPP